MHFVCVPYAFPYAYIFSLSALLPSQTVLLYALYAVKSGVVCSYSVHRLVFDCIQCIQIPIVRLKDTIDETDENAYMPRRNA